MKTAMRILVGLLGLFNLVIGLAFLFAPAGPAAAFFIEPVGIQGMATIRADFSGFFVGAASFALLGAWRASASLLDVPLVMLAIALFGRFISIGLDGMAPTAALPMIAEAVMISVLLLAKRSFRP